MINVFDRNGLKVSLLSYWITVPTSAIYRLGAGYKDKSFEPIFYIQNNTRLRERVAQVALPQVKTFPVMISGGYHAQVRLYLPPGLREDEITRYPLILHV
jgi:inactive dipeptidyl peptidase 10